MIKAFIGILFWLGLLSAQPTPRMQRTRPNKTILCDDTEAQPVHVETRRLTILSFPVIPKDVVPGENSFDFKRVNNDVVIKSLRSGARTNIVVYMPERRCAFELMTVDTHGDGILNVTDPPDKQFEVKFQ